MTPMTEKGTKPNYIEKFFQELENWVKVPQHADPDQQRRAEIIQILSSLVLVIGLITLTLSPLVFSNLLRDVGITFGMMALIFLVLMLNRKGKTLLASRLFVISIWFFNLVLILLTGGFNSPYLSSFIAIVIMGGLILGELRTFQLAGISIAAYLVLFIIETQELIPTAILDMKPSAVLLINSVNIFLAAAVLILVMVRYQQYFRELISKDSALEETNRTLQGENQAREEAELLLRQSENRLKSALMELPYPTMLHTENGEILLVNTAWVESSGYTPENFPRFADWLDHMFSDHSSEIVAILDRLTTGTVSSQEGSLEIYRSNGETLNWYTRWNKLPPLLDGRTLILTTATDMTGLLSIESALRESEETLSKFSLVTNDGMWDWDLQTDRVLFDPHYYTMAGYEVDEFPHELEEFRKRVHPEDVDEVFRQAEAHLNGEVDRFLVEFRFLQKDGSWLWIMGRGKIIEQDENGNPLRFSGTHTNISSQKAIEEELNTYQLQLEDVVEARTQELNERITEVERLNIALTNILDDYQAANERLSVLRDHLAAANEELESLTLSLSKDLLPPILSIQEIVTGLVETTAADLTKEEMKALQGIKDNAAHVNHQINDLVRISQLSQQELQVIDLDPKKIIKKVFKSFAKEIKDLKIKTTIKDLPSCRADPALLEIVFEILISNSIKYSGGQKKPEILIGYQPSQEADRVTYFVQDNGVGFNPDVTDLVFSKFLHLDTEGNSQGRGIGLTLAKLIINKHQGSIWADSQENKGATFYFDLASPLSENS